MSERAYRFIFGLSLVAFLLFDWRYGIYALISILIFEGITNYRIPKLITKLRNSTGYTSSDIDNYTGCKFNYEAERLLRFSVAGLIALSYIFYNDLLWFLPWFIALNLMLAGITGICPMVIVYRKAGFK